MSAAFPTALDTFTDPDPATTLLVNNHKQRHIDLQDSIAAIEAKVGITNSADTSSMDYKVRAELPASIAAATRYPITPTGGNGVGFDIFSPGVLSEWNTDYGSGITISLDNSVQFAGNPTIRVDINAGTSGSKTLCGTSTATGKIPFGWDSLRLAVAMRTTNKALFNSLSVFVGDSSYANYWVGTIPVTTQYIAANYLQTGEFIWFRNLVAPTPTGGPVAAQRMRAKIVANITASGQTESVWFGFFGVLPKRQKSTLVCVADDGTTDHYNFLAPLCRYYDIPMTFAIVGARIGTGGYMTTQQILDLQSDKSQLFSFANHSYNHLSYNAIGAAADYADFELNAALMQSMGLGIGAKIAIYPSGEFDDDLIKLLQAGGYYGGRCVNYAVAHTYDQMWPAGDKGAFIHAPCSFTDNGVTVASVLSALDTVITAKGATQLMFHKSGATDDSYQWSYDKMYNLFAELANRRDAGTLEIVTYDKYLSRIRGLSSCKR